MPTLERPWEDRCAIIMCEDCGRVFSVRARAERAIRRGERTAKCHMCRRGVPLVVDDVMRAFWLSLYTMAELVEIAEASWGPRSDWPESWRKGFTFVPSTIELAA